MQLPKQFKPLPTLKLSAAADYSHPPELPPVAHLDDPANHVMLDLTHANTITIKPTATISEAAMEMRVAKTHLLLVIDDENHIIGLIGSEDILGEKPLKVSQERHIKRSEIIVRMVMTPHDKIIAIAHDALKFAKVGDIVVTLHQHHQHYGLAVEIDPLNQKHQTVLGLFSLSQISKQLGMDVMSENNNVHSILQLQKKLDQDFD